jgi:hypothetical protein
MNHQWLGHRDSVFRLDHTFLLPATLDDTHVRDDAPALPLGWLDEDALVHPGRAGHPASTSGVYRRYR